MQSKSLQESVSWLFDGERFVRNVRISWDCGRFTSIEKVDPRDSIRPVLALPGLINLHTHLELTGVAGKTPRHKPFPEWVEALREVTEQWTLSQFQNSVQQGISQALGFGTTTILDVGNTSANWEAVCSAPIRLLAMRELIGLNPEKAMDRFHKVHQELLASNATSTGLGMRGMSLHAPYSCAPNLIAKASDYQATTAFPITIHMAESQEESELYSQGQGLFRTWLDQFSFSHPFQSALPNSILETACQWGLRLPAVLVHGNTFGIPDLEHIVKTHSFLVHCPQSARWFGHPQLDIKACKALGVQLCIGTDSSASAESLSLWDQLSLLAKTWPSLSVEDSLSMVTSVPGQALKHIGPVGVVKPNALADFILLELPQDFDGNDWRWLLQQPPKILCVIVNGETLFQGNRI
jgi:cytosine/adenosine deaminase-related metal-dependent hydrolase